MHFPVLFYISLLIVIVTALVGGFRYRNLPRPLKTLEWLIIINIVEMGVQWILASIRIHNLWTSHFYSLVEIIFVTFMYSSWVKQKQFKLILFLCLAGFSILWIISKFTFEPFSIADDGTATVSKILQILFSAYLLVIVVRESEIIWTNDPRLWVVAGTIIYSAGSIFLFALFNKMLQISHDRLKVVWFLNWILIIVSNVLYARGFLCKK
jgi:hypothetical protein